MSKPPLTDVNIAVNLLMPKARFELSEKNRLYLIRDGCKHYPRTLWRLRADRTWPHDKIACYVSGGTDVQALCQLALWSKGEPRRPMRYWEYITGPDVWPESIRDRGKKLTDYLASSSYVDMTDCVLCGAKDSSDWWSLDNDHGPCCRSGRCSDKTRDVNNG